MTEATINIYVLPTGLRRVFGYVSMKPTPRGPRPEIGVCKLTCESGRAAWFAFRQPNGAKLTPGLKSARAAFAEAREVLGCLMTVTGEGGE